MEWTDMPEPECSFGYPLTQLEELMGEREYQELGEFMYGQTMSICQGECGEGGHGTVIYSHDVYRFLRGLPVID